MTTIILVQKIKLMPKNMEQKTKARKLLIWVRFRWTWLSFIETSVVYLGCITDAYTTTSECYLVLFGVICLICPKYFLRLPRFVGGGGANLGSSSFLLFSLSYAAPYTTWQLYPFNAKIIKVVSFVFTYYQISKGFMPVQPNPTSPKNLF